MKLNKYYSENKPDIMSVCGWCNKVIYQGDGNKENVTHGICHECFEKTIVEEKERQSRNEGGL